MYIYLLPHKIEIDYSKKLKEMLEGMPTTAELATTEFPEPNGTGKVECSCYILAIDERDYMQSTDQVAKEVAPFGFELAKPEHLIAYGRKFRWDEVEPRQTKTIFALGAKGRTLYTYEPMKEDAPFSSVMMLNRVDGNDDWTVGVRMDNEEHQLGWMGDFEEEEKMQTHLVLLVKKQ